MEGWSEVLLLGAHWLFYSTGFLQQPVPTRTELCRLIGQRWEMQDGASLSADKRNAMNELKALLFKASAKV